MREGQPIGLTEEIMAKTGVRLEGGAEGAPERITLENDRLTATLHRVRETYHLASLKAGGEYELLAEPSPLLFCYDGKEHLAVPLPGVVVEEETPEEARLRLAMNREGLAIELTLSLRTGRPFLEVEATCVSARDWQGLIYFSCLPAPGFTPTAYPWIAGKTLQAEGFAYANCMGVPLLTGDPRGHDGHVLALGFPLSVNYRDLFFHADTQTRRMVAGIGEGISRPAAPPPDDEPDEAPAPAPKRGLFKWIRREREPEPPPPLPPLSLSIPYRAGVAYRLPLHVWALTGQYRNLAGEWIKGTGFVFDNPEIRSVPESLAMTLAFLKDGAPFIDGKGYPMRCARYTRAPGQGIGGHIHLYGNAALAAALYRCWIRYREEWMYERAITIADFIVESRRPNGRVPELMDPNSGQWARLGDGTHYEGVGLCIDALLRLYQLRRDAEHKDDIRLKRTATRFLDLALEQRRRRIDRERRRGKRRHDQETGFPYSGADVSESTNVNMLIILERVRQLTHDRRIEHVRADAEKWVLHNVIHDMSWRGGDPIHRGLETRSLLRFLEYAVLRCEATKGKRYLEIAESLASFFMLTLVPKDLEWCAGRTKGLQIANAEWRALTTFYADHVTPVPALHRLGKLCNDRFYAQLADYLVHVAMVAQCDEKGVPGYGGWMPAVNSPDGNAFPLNGLPYDGELCVTSIVPAVLETYLYLTEKK
jgi:hypothetical protein